MSDLETPCKTDDGFGILPVTYMPGPLKRLLGHTCFRLDAESVSVGATVGRLETSWADIAAVEAVDSCVILKRLSGPTMKIACGSRYRHVAGLAARLHQEYNDFHSIYDQPAPVESAAGMALFFRCLDYRALPYVRAVEALLKTAADNYYTDIHLEPVGSARVKITCRQNGEVKPAGEISSERHERLTARLKHLAGCLSHVCDAAQEGAFRHNGFSVRVSTFPSGAGERVSLRLITALRFPRVADLGWKTENAAAWLNQIKSGRGLYLISGQVGSGKTTAMYATLAELSASEDGLRVVTIEDPVEAVIPGICQSSLDQLREKDLAAAFKHLLRQDPNIIALGEIRDVKCIREAMQAGLSGHLVLATFHAGSIGEALDRIRQMSGEDCLVLSGLKGILHLSLIHRQQGVFPEVDFAVFDGKELRKII